MTTIKLMMKRWMIIPGLVMLVALLAVQVQAGRDLSVVYVTTQDFAVLRGGPGTHWDRLAVLPYDETYRATGRTVDGDWLQIAYTGPLEPGVRNTFTRDGVTYGWIAYWLLNWTGDILQLPIDGVVMVPVARAAGPTMILSPGEYMYVGEVDPSTQVDTPNSTAVKVEVTGRLGSADAGSFWLQFKLGGKFYWTGSWAVGVPYGYLELPDAAYLYTYGRLLTQLRSEISRASAVLNNISSRWQALDDGQTTTCNDIPDDYALLHSSFNEEDLASQPIYQPTVNAIEDARTSINAALAKFRVVCSEANRLVSPEEIRDALDDVDAARRNLNVALNLVGPLQRRDPILSPD
ncbi:MAG TPA: hypothetical protein VHL11_07690 [Phototrophicaceae bacterium]|nr:hypothetical protein [Phototrophicaceae bacterium]